MNRSGTGLILITLIAVTLSLTPATPASATPPNIPSKSTAQSELNTLVVASEGSMTGYSRDLFPHWIIISGTCDTRETVLKRDGTNVVVGSNCYPTSGSWRSPYDGATWTSPSVEAPGVRERPRRPTTHRGHRQRQPVKGRSGPLDLETTAVVLLLHLRQDVDRVQVPLVPQTAVEREDRAAKHA